MRKEEKKKRREERRETVYECRCMKRLIDSRMCESRNHNVAKNDRGKSVSKALK